MILTGVATNGGDLVDGIKGQMNIFDFIPMPTPEREKKRHLGYISAQLAESIRGRPLRFRDLETMTGQCVLVERRRQSATDWAVYLVERFIIDYEDTWRFDGSEYVKSNKTDRCIMRDSYKNNGNHLLYFNELYCMGGRFDGAYEHQSSIYEIREKLEG